MRFPSALRLTPLLLTLSAVPLAAQTPAPTTATDDSLYSKSLHFTGRGIVYNYEKGLQRLTGFPAERLGCTKASCHVKSCDVCHGTEANGRAAYSVAQARSEKACAACHGEPDPKDPDVHVRKGLKCMDCHSAREIHGDGKPYDSLWQQGALEVRCERCHQDLRKIPSHTVHGGKIDCGACHTRETPTCFNCHIDSRLSGVQDVSIKREGLAFLINHGGRVKLGNLLTYVYKSGTAITVAPTYPHKISRLGRACTECHGTRIARDVAEGALVLTRFENGELTSITGVVPVVDPGTWKLAFLTRENGRWVRLADPQAPIVAFSGFSSPLTREQLAKLVNEGK